MRIGIDVDDTITNTIEEIGVLLKKNNLEHLSKDFDSYSIEDIRNYDELIRNNIDDILSNCTLKENANTIINRLKEDKNEIYIITARNNYYSDNVEKITIDYLNKNNIVYDKIFFNCKSKKEICVNNNVDIMIDDNYNIINSFKDSNVKAILFNTIYNLKRDYDGVRVNNWNEIEKYFENELTN